MYNVDMLGIPQKYIPKYLTKKDRATQKRNINRARRSYKKDVYVDRPYLKSYKRKESPHVVTAKKYYKVNQMVPSKTLAQKTKCSVHALKRITKKGRGAYYSSGSRPMQTAQSWARARLASAITGGPSSAYDYHILKEGCSKNSPALRMARKTCKKMKRKCE
jgi:hypothetical protein